MAQSRNNVTRKIASGGAIATSNFDVDKTVEITVLSEVIPNKMVVLHILNDSTEDIRFRFGATQVLAETVTATDGIKVKAGSENSYMVPFDATYWAWISTTNVGGLTIGTVWG